MIFRLMGADVKKLVIPKPNDLCIYKNDETGYKISIRFIDDTYVLAGLKFSTHFLFLHI